MVDRDTAEVFPWEMTSEIDDATRARHGSYSHRNTRYCWKEEEVEEREVEYERMQMDVIDPTPCIEYISATINKPKLCREIVVQ